MTNPDRQNGDSAPEAGRANGETEPGTATSGEAAKSPEELRHDIEETREELGDTVDALSQKADVKAQVKEAADERKEKVRAKQAELKEKVSGIGGGAGGDAGETAKDLLGQLSERASRDPLPYLGGALAAGLLVGMALRGRR